MINVHSKALERTIEVDRIIGHIRGEQPGPTLVFIGGIHGNEPSGVFALKKVINELKEKDTPIRGNIYALGGNLRALEHGERYETEDLNRVWTANRVAELPEDKSEAVNKDVAEQIELYKVISTILDSEKGPFYFFDLHTTSSESLPFLTVNDSLLNRKYTVQYPLPIILGIEEYLEGPVLSYLNELGYVAFGFEAGQHDDMASIDNNVAFIYLSMVFTGCVDEKDINYHRCYKHLAKTTGDVRKIYEIYFRYLIKPEEDFTMLPGYFNFQRIREGQGIANSNGHVVKAKKDGRIFMPLYQPQGEDGFFAIRRVMPVFLRLSTILRKVSFDRLLPLLPGVKWASTDKSELIVNRNIAIFLAKQFFHLLGYRSKTLDKTHYIMRNREARSRNEEYENEQWAKFRSKSY